MLTHRNLSVTRGAPPSTWVYMQHKYLNNKATYIVIKMIKHYLLKNVYFRKKTCCNYRDP